MVTAWNDAPLLPKSSAKSSLGLSSAPNLPFVVHVDSPLRDVTNASDASVAKQSIVGETVTGVNDQFRYIFNTV